MIKSRTQNAIRNIIFNLLSKFINIFLPFLVRAIFINQIGTELLGLNNLFSSILQVLNLSELGFNDAVVFAMYKPVAENDNVTICAILNFYRKVYHVIGLVIILSGLMITPFLDRFITGTVPAGVNIYVLFSIYLMNTAISYMFFAYKGSLIVAYQRIDISSKITILTKVLVNILQLLVIVTIKDIYAYTIILVIGSIINNLLTGYTAKKQFPDIKCAGKLNREIKNIIKEKIKGLVIYKVCMSSRNSFDSIFISAFVGLSATAIYGNYFYILGAVASFSSAITEALLPTIGNSIVTETEEKNYDDMNKINFIYLWIAGFCTICMMNLYQPFTELFFGKENMFPFSIVVLFCMYYYVLRMGDVRAVYSDAHGLWWENRYRLLLETISNIILNYILGKYFGVIGIIIATLVSLFIFGFVGASKVLFQYYFKKYKIKEFWILNLKMASVMCVTAMIVFPLCQLIHGNLWFILAVRFIICCLVINIIFYLLYQRTSLFQHSYDWLLKRIHIKKFIRGGKK